MLKGGNTWKASLSLQQRWFTKNELLRVSSGCAIKNLSIKIGIRGHNLATKQQQGKGWDTSWPWENMQHMLGTNNWSTRVCVCVCARACVCVCSRMHFFLHRKPDRLAHSGEMSELMALHFLWHFQGIQDESIQTGYEHHVLPELEMLPSENHFPGQGFPVTLE